MQKIKDVSYQASEALGRTRERRSAFPSRKFRENIEPRKTRENTKLLQEKMICDQAKVRAFVNARSRR